MPIFFLRSNDCIPDEQTASAPSSSAFIFQLPIGQSDAYESCILGLNSYVLEIEYAISYSMLGNSTIFYECNDENLQIFNSLNDFKFV